jgi:hypothetical protein
MFMFFIINHPPDSPAALIFQVEIIFATVKMINSCPSAPYFVLIPEEITGFNME